MLQWEYQLCVDHAVSRWHLTIRGLRTLTARVRDTVVKRVGREQAQLDLDSRDGVYRMGLADGVCADLTQADAANLALLDQFSQGLDRGLDGNVGVAPRTFKDVDCLSASQHLDCPLDRRADTFWGAVGPRLHVEGAFDAEHDLAGIFGILFKVVFDQMQRVCLGRAVVDALHASQSGSTRVSARCSRRPNRRFMEVLFFT